MKCSKQLRLYWFLLWRQNSVVYKPVFDTRKTKNHKFKKKVKTKNMQKEEIMLQSKINGIYENSKREKNKE